MRLSLEGLQADIKLNSPKCRERADAVVVLRPWQGMAAHRAADSAWQHGDGADASQVR